ncbi:hypothetical protein Glove_30g33 [Diversispora epigaea]|uniref:Uncharacterized protein n=1 Tax=Diversispora epigaea TaxID=1348612 RepID=A0A397JRF7_9GLOM|nr:hypothetical protein Glove_30g33 [Diversispora epigaea]
MTKRSWRLFTRGRTTQCLSIFSGQPHSSANRSIYVSELKHDSEHEMKSARTCRLKSVGGLGLVCMETQEETLSSEETGRNFGTLYPEETQEETLSSEETGLWNLIYPL